METSPTGSSSIRLQLQATGDVLCRILRNELLEMDVPYFFNNIWRMDWGLGNPNKTAALIAMAMIAVWGLAYIRRWGFWAAIILFVALGVCLMHTVSRGGLVAMLGGVVPLILLSPRPWPRARVVGIVVGVWIIVGSAVYLQTLSRYAQGVNQEDRSISNRFEIWKTAPRMMVDAPSGWGIGNSGEVYVQWYQPLGKSEAYRTLVSSHITWLVEFGWLGRFAYLLGWLSVFLLCWPSRSRCWLAIPLGIWIAFAVASFFSSVAESPWLWILPGCSLVAVLVFRIYKRSWPGARLWAIPIGAACLLLAAFYLAGQSHAPTIKGAPDRVSVGQGKPQVWLVVDTTVLGGRYGHTLRRFLKSQEPQVSIGLVQSADALPPELSGSVLCLAGQLLPSSLPTPHSFLLINPGFSPGQLAAIVPLDGIGIEVAIGEFTQSSSVKAWEKIARPRELAQTGDYVAEWPEVIFTKPK